MNHWVPNLSPSHSRKKGLCCPQPQWMNCALSCRLCHAPPYLPPIAGSGLWTQPESWIKYGKSVWEDLKTWKSAKSYRIRRSCHKSQNTRSQDRKVSLGPQNLWPSPNWEWVPAAWFSTSGWQPLCCRCFRPSCPWQRWAWNLSDHLHGGIFWISKKKEVRWQWSKWC